MLKRVSSIILNFELKILNAEMFGSPSAHFQHGLNRIGQLSSLQQRGGQAVKRSSNVVV